MNFNKQLRLIKFLEIFWLVIALFSLGFGAYETINVGINHAYIFFVFTFIAGILFMLRKKQRIRMEEKSKNE